MPSSRWSLTISSALIPDAIAASRSSSRPLRAPSTIRRSSRSPTGSAASSAARWSLSAAESTPSNSSSSRASGSCTRFPSSSYRRRSHTRSSAASRCSSGIWARGRIFAACTIAESSPASTASWRKTELSTVRAAGLSPNDTFETPSVVWMPG
ncbi:Uncharacterised protein [Mycobacteroides abscessus]|nr:Uncharacterised protein [Mycobacteroides abscessus]